MIYITRYGIYNNSNCLINCNTYLIMYQKYYIANRYNYNYYLYYTERIIQTELNKNKECFSYKKLYNARL